LTFHLAYFLFHERVQETSFEAVVLGFCPSSCTIPGMWYKRNGRCESS